MYTNTHVHSCMSVHIHMHTYTCTYIRAHTHVCVYVRACTLARSHTYVFVYMCICMYMWVWICTSTCTCIHIRAHTCTGTHTHVGVRTHLCVFVRSYLCVHMCVRVHSVYVYMYACASVRLVTTTPWNRSHTRSNVQKHQVFCGTQFKAFMLKVSHYVVFLLCFGFEFDYFCCLNQILIGLDVQLYRLRVEILMGVAVRRMGLHW